MAIECPPSYQEVMSRRNDPLPSYTEAVGNGGGSPSQTGTTGSPYGGSSDGGASSPSPGISPNGVNYLISCCFVSCAGIVPLCGGCMAYAFVVHGMSEARDPLTHMGARLGLGISFLFSMVFFLVMMVEQHTLSMTPIFLLTALFILASGIIISSSLASIRLWKSRRRPSTECTP